MKFEIAKPIGVPRDVTVCPECNGSLLVQATTKDIRDIILDCKNDTRKNPHRNWQGEWEGPYALVRNWIVRGCKPRAIATATLLGSRTSNGCWSGEQFGLQAGSKFKVDLNTIRVGSIQAIIHGQEITFTGEWIDMERDGNGWFWPWPTELLDFKRPAGAPKKVLAEPGELFKL